MTLRVTTIGDGAMATVCSQILARKSGAPQAADGGRLEVRVWGRNPERLAEIQRAGENLRYLPGIELSGNIHFEADDAAALEGAGLIVCAVPTQFIRAVLGRLKAHIGPGVPVVSVSKGIEIETLQRPSEIIVEALGPRPGAALSGPSIAGELARMLPATMVVATNGLSPAGGVVSDQAEFAKWVQQLFTTSYLRVYRNKDLPGVEFAGAMKNVIAIAAGILDGMRAGNNAKAALLTRGLVEITRLGVAKGALAETFSGLAGLGDLMTTCVSPEGRNRSFGERVGRGEKPEEVLAAMVGVVEGVPTCKSVVQMARALVDKQGSGIAMPISEGLHAVLFEGRDPRGQLADLLSRALKSE